MLGHFTGEQYMNLPILLMFQFGFSKQFVTGATVV